LVVGPDNRETTGAAVDRHRRKAVDAELLVGKRLAILRTRQLDWIAIQIVIQARHLFVAEAGAAIGRACNDELIGGVSGVGI